MKAKTFRTRLLLALLFIIALVSCEQSGEPAPQVVDPATNFIGTYKGKINTGDGSLSLVWQITKASGEYLKVTHTDTFEGEESSIITFTKVTIQDATTLNFDEDIIDEGDKVHFEGVALLTGKVLSVTLQMSDDEGYESATSFDLVRQ